jgi:hypothetical protein
MGLMDILNQYANPGATPPAQVEEHFDQAAREADPADLSRGLSAAFRSDATPPFGQTVGNLFGQSDPQQQAGLLNQLVQALGSGALAGAAGNILGHVLGNAPAGAAAPEITPSQASQLSPDDVTTLATHAQTQDDSIVEKLSAFYAQHPTLVKSIGAAGLAVALGHLRRQ